MRVTLDTNVLVYALNRRDGKHALASDILVRAAGADCVQTLQSLCECFHVITRKHHVGVAQATDLVTRLKARFPIVAADRPHLDDAMRVMRDHRIAFWDALMWATARAAGCRAVLSEDLQDGRDLEGVRLVDPFKPENRALIDLILPPSEA